MKALTAMFFAPILLLLAVNSATAEGQRSVRFDHVVSPIGHTDLPDEPEAKVVTRLSLSDDTLTIVFDGEVAVELEPSQFAEGTWEGLYLYPEYGYLPGLVVEMSYDGRGERIALLTVGWTNPIQLMFSEGDKVGTLDLEASRECTCTQSVMICLSKDCTTGGGCQGAPNKTCFWSEDSSTELEQFTSWQALEGLDVVDFLFER